MPEPGKATLKCGGCGQRLTIHGYNSFIFAYWKTPEMTFLRTECDKKVWRDMEEGQFEEDCGFVNDNFIAEEVFTYLLQTEIGATLDYEAPEEVKAAFAKLFGEGQGETLLPPGTHKVPIYKLSGSLEALVNKWSQVLDSIPDDHLLDEMSLPAPGSTLPQFWVAEDSPKEEEE